MNSSRGDSFPVKIRVYDHRNKTLSALIPAIYPKAQPLGDFISGILPELTQRPLRFYTNRDDNAISLISAEPLDDTYYHILVVIEGGEYENREQFLQDLPPEVKGSIGSFLSPSNMLETSLGIFRVTGINLCRDFVSSYKGIASLRKVENGMILRYYSENRIGGLRIDITSQKEPVQGLETKFYTDIASSFEDFRFKEIQSAVEWGENILIEHISTDGRRQLKTFAPQDSEGRTYRDTGNRILRMDLLEEYGISDLRLPLNMGQERQAKEALVYTKNWINRMEDQVGGRVCDAVSLERGEFYVLTWHEGLKEGRIYHSHTEKRIPEGSLVRLISPTRPNSLVYLRTVNAFLLSFTGASELYLIEPWEEGVELKAVGSLFAIGGESFATSGEVEDLTSLSLSSGREILVIVQRGRIAMYRIEDITDA